MKLRVKFAKYGAMKFIGHLDMMRYFQKAIRRSGIAIEYTGGYSPHQIMSFAAPLGVGHETCGDYFDISVSSITDSKSMTDALQKTMSPGCDILDIVLLPDDAGSAMASVMAADYRIRFREGMEPEFDIASAAALFSEKESVIVTKKTKKSEADIDLKPSVYKLWLSEGKICMQVDASSAGNIKPDLVLNALYSFYGEELIPNSYITERLETYGRNEDGLLIPLSDFGKHF